MRSDRSVGIGIGPWGALMIALSSSADAFFGTTCRLSSQQTLTRPVRLTRRRAAAGAVPAGFAPDLAILPTVTVVPFDTTQNDLETPAVGPDRIRANILGVLQTKGNPTNGLSFTLKEMISFNYQSVIESRVRLLLSPMGIQGLTVSVSRVNFAAVLIRVGFSYRDQEYSEELQVKA